ncbi:NUDIX hydrolase [Clostridium beijerinckii]|uniref:NUDIX hydrolase n=1 Tax=Clostridium beijerinckii TaxID=1520 RepID=UPI00242DD1AE|nr:NUDIX domain-containing protein [Clostridium beijerinckii]
MCSSKYYVELGVDAGEEIMSNYILELRKFVGKRPLIQCGTCVIISNQNKILMQLRTDNKKWGLPGGSIEIGEKVEETAIREVKEETGLTICLKDLKLFGVFSGERQHYIYPHGDEVYNVVTVFTTNVYGGELQIDNEENSSLEFFEIDNLPIDISPPDIEIIEKYISTVI